MGRLKLHHETGNSGEVPFNKIPQKELRIMFMEESFENMPAEEDSGVDLTYSFLLE